MVYATGPDPGSYGSGLGDIGGEDAGDFAADCWSTYNSNPALFEVTRTAATSTLSETGTPPSTGRCELGSGVLARGMRWGSSRTIKEGLGQTYPGLLEKLCMLSRCSNFCWL